MNTNTRTVTLIDGYGKRLGDMATVMTNAALKQQLLTLMTEVINDPSTTNVLPEKNRLFIGYDDAPLFCINSHSTPEFKLAVSSMYAALAGNSYEAVCILLDECERLIMDSVTLQRNTSSIH